MTGTERAIRWSTIAAVAAVALVAAWVSYDHALAVVREHGESGVVARIYPGTIDGLIYSASMVLLDAARRKVPAPLLARWLLAAGIGATVAVNIAAGAAYGPLGAVVAAWPALALVGSYELLMWLVRTAAKDAKNADAGRCAEPNAAVNAGASAAPAPVPVGERQVTRQLSRQSRQRQTRQTGRSRQGRGARRSAADWDDAALPVLEADPQMSLAELARQLGTSERTAGRIKARLASPVG